MKIVSRQNSGSQAFNPGVAFDVNLMGIAGGGRDNCGGMLNFGRQNSDFKSDWSWGVKICGWGRDGGGPQAREKERGWWL